MKDLERGAELVRYARAVHARGWVANHDGNLSARIGDDRFLITPTAMSKADVTLDDLVVVDGTGQVLSGHRKAFSEWSLHAACYRERPDARAVVHAHPPAASAFACAGVELPDVFIAEAVVSLGERVPTAAFSPPYGDEAATPLRPLLATSDAVLLASHGALAVGSCLEQAFLRLELVEHLARIALHARALGGVRPLPPEELAGLLDRRRRAGLGPEARAASVGPTVVSSPLPASANLPSLPGAVPSDPSRFPGPAPSAWSSAPHVRTEAPCGVVYGAASPAPTGAEEPRGTGDTDLADLVRREVERALTGR